MGTAATFAVSGSREGRCPPQAELRGAGPRSPRQWNSLGPAGTSQTVRMGGMTRTAARRKPPLSQCPTLQPTQTLLLGRHPRNCLTQLGAFSFVLFVFLSSLKHDQLSCGPLGSTL